MQSNNTIKMVFVDLDGTLLRDVSTVTERTKKAFRQVRDAGIVPVICTGRLAYESDFAVEAIGADGYLVAMNGLAVYSNYAAGELIYEAYMEPEIVSSVIDILYNENIFFEAYAGNRAYVQADRASLVHTCGWDEAHAAFFGGRMLTVADLKQYLLKSGVATNKFFVCVAETQRIPEVRAKLEQISGVDTLSSGKHFIEVVPQNIDKSRAVRAISAVAGLTREQIMVIGDSENDVGMFDEANICVAMENACEQLKAKANYYAPSNQEDGVAWALENLLLGERPEPQHGQIEFLAAEQIEAAMQNSTRQYFSGNLKLPQTLPFLFDENVESGINVYPKYRWEAAHYHTTATEYCYILSGETKYINLSKGKEYCFREGDFYILHRNTPYLQKCKAGCRLLFFKIPGMNDKMLISMTAEMKHWCTSWDVKWNTTEQ